MVWQALFKRRTTIPIVLTTQRPQTSGEEKRQMPGTAKDAPVRLLCLGKTLPDHGPT